LIPSDYVVGVTDPGSIGFEKFLNITPEKITQKRQAFPQSLQMAHGSSQFPQSGNVNNIVIFIRFNDETGFANFIKHYNDMFNSTDSASMNGYFMEASYNQLAISSTFYPSPQGAIVNSYQDSEDRDYYQPYDAVTNPNGYTGGEDGTERRAREHTLLANAVNAVSASVPSSLNIDSDDDGFVDNVCFIITGSSEGWNSLLWPHKWTLSSQDAFINDKQVWDYNLQLETVTKVGVLCHEMFHSVGAPDLYHYSKDGLQPVGTWDLMQSTLETPQHMGAYMKYRYGNWINLIPEITTSGVYTLNSLRSYTNNCFKIDRIFV